MKERPVIFNGEMVRAILDGRKTQTRRTLNWKRQPYTEMAERDDGSLWPWAEDGERGGDIWFSCPFGEVGDRLWVRETFAGHYLDDDQIQDIKDGRDKAEDLCEYRADYSDDADCVDGWTPSIHMPRWASRITLEITAVRVERLNDISEEDARAEGVRAIENNFGNGPAYCDYLLPNLNDTAEWYNRASDSFKSLWKSIYGVENWRANPWVWVIEFRRVGGA
ncbi:hypothetical protein [Serratia sp. G204Y]|uniref:hypothetical protein n=1 Tax=Serratia sp. G204Y TaxID=3444319 RepID=UPI003EBBF825